MPLAAPVSTATRSDRSNASLTSVVASTSGISRSFVLCRPPATGPAGPSRGRARRRARGRVPSSSLVSDANDLTVVTLNVHGGKRHRGISVPRLRPHRPPPPTARSNGAFDVAGALRGFDADVLVVQEG